MLGLDLCVLCASTFLRFPTWTLNAETQRRRDAETRRRGGRRGRRGVREDRDDARRRTALVRRVRVRATLAGGSTGWSPRESAGKPAHSTALRARRTRRSG